MRPLLPVFVFQNQSLKAAVITSTQTVNIFFHQLLFSTLEKLIFSHRSHKKTQGQIKPDLSVTQDSYRSLPD